MIVSKLGLKVVDSAGDVVLVVVFEEVEAGSSSDVCWLVSTIKLAVVSLVGAAVDVELDVVIDVVVVGAAVGEESVELSELKMKFLKSSKKSQSQILAELVDSVAALMIGSEPGTS